MMSAQRGGEGGNPKADAVRKLSKGGCVKMQTKGGGGGQKIRKTCRRHMYMAPYQKIPWPGGFDAKLLSN